MFLQTLMLDAEVVISYLIFIWLQYSMEMFCGLLGRNPALEVLVANVRRADVVPSLCHIRSCSPRVKIFCGLLIRE